MPPSQPADGQADRASVLAGIGGRLRQARTEVGISARELARKAGVSVSLVSQIENGKARPSVASLYALVQHLNLTVDELFEPAGAKRDDADRPVQPKVGRAFSANGGPAAPGEVAVPQKLISAALVQLGETRGTLKLEGGITWERLTPRDVPGADFLKITYDVGGASCPEGLRQTHPGHEFGYLLSGRLGVTVGFDTSEIGPGDSVYFDSTTPHRLFNAGDEPAVGVWMVHAPFREAR
ncbi:XRE family transcriptional regulator [Amycolatopsis rhabdoformis]|uniref:XRE family transcriptional regulator n=1 Tax=Amycolatopsis rhabdoformis TaxID=1448059 RepID=A0ABZ1ICU8_9PSEU|nr:XRE family transcriptional regulator [Amycolatopsis rhabdoformis]WSE31866.1 XRE family transcriptional regulator [Amycolatopsis rhabdoformis]